MDRRKRQGGPVSRRNFLQLTSAAAGLFALQACGGGGAPSDPGAGASAAPAGGATEAVSAGAPRYGGVITTAYSGIPAQLDPALVLGNEENHINFAVYEGLTSVSNDLIPQPRLAESWEASDDLTEWTFTLREGVLFHHGTPLTAADVVYTFERVLDPALGSPIRTNLTFLDGIEAVDDHTVLFRLNSPHVDFPTVVGAYQLHIVPHDRTEEQLGSEALGTGPFRLAEFSPGDNIRFERNEEYWEEGLPYLDGLRQVHIPEQSTQIAALNGGTIEVMHDLGFESMSTVTADSTLKVAQSSSGSYQVIVMRVDQEPFTDNRVRQAMKLCCDRAAMLQVSVQGNGDMGNDQPVPPINPYYAGIPIPEQNHERARELLAEAGYPDGLSVTLYTSPVQAGMVQMAIAFQEMARPAGIDVEIQRTPTDSYWGEYWMKVPLCVSNWGLRPTADETLTIAYHSESSWNESGFQSEELDTLLETARGEPDDALRAELYAQAQQLVHDEGGSIIPYHFPFMSAMRANVQNLGPDPISTLNFRETWLSEA
jgi:peptide/nickel transport system substrate-binding protein